MHCLIQVCFWEQKNEQGSVASMFTRSEPMQLYLWGMIKDMAYINNPSTENGKAVQRGKGIQDTGSSHQPPECWHAKNILLGFMSLCEMKKTISGTFFKYGEYKPKINCHTHTTVLLFVSCMYLHAYKYHVHACMHTCLEGIFGRRKLFVARPGSK